MKEKFKDISVEPDTLILLRGEIKVGETDAVYEKWEWDGIYGESVIFFNEDIPNLNEEDITNMVKEDTALIQNSSQTTFSITEKHTFLNFNFKVL